MPAFRVVNAKGILSGAVYFETNDMQKQLLEEDGIEVRRVDGAFWVDLKRYGWKNTIEDVEMFRRLFGETKK